MRKESREMPEDWAWNVLEKAPYVSVAMIDSNSMPYSIPLSLARKGNAFYFHGALEGKKMDAIKNNPNVFLSAVTKCRPIAGPLDNSFTLEYQSAMAVGKAEIIENTEEKIEALRIICERFLPNHMDYFDASIQRSLVRTAVVKITILEPPTGKRKQYDANGQEMKYGRME